MLIKLAALFSFLCLSLPSAHADNSEADVRLHSLNDSNVKGTVQFWDKKDPDGVEIHYQLEGLYPEETYAILFRKQGNCDKRDINSVTQLLTEKNLYTGDVPYLQSDEEGKVDKTVRINNASVNAAELLSSEPGPNALALRSLIVADKTNTNDPANPGVRVACGVVMPK